MSEMSWYSKDVLWHPGNLSNVHEYHKNAGKTVVFPETKLHVHKTWVVPLQDWIKLNVGASCFDKINEEK